MKRWLGVLALAAASVCLPLPAHADVVDRFHERWERTYLVKAPGNTLRVALAKSGPLHKQTVSEGQGYGMLITVAVGTRRQFDKLWRFSRNHPSEVDPRLMDWKVPESKQGDDSAFDGDSDMAYALILAHRRWGSPRYLRDAKQVITALEQSAVGPNSRLPLLGDWVLQPDSGYDQWEFRSSDCMPANFAAFGQVSDPHLWQDVSNACVAALDTQSRSTPTGLVSDFVRVRTTVRAVPPDFIEAPTDGEYNYNAGRVPWRLALGDERAQSVAKRITAWAQKTTGGNPLRLRAGYRLDGSPTRNSDYFSTFFAAPMAVAAATDPALRTWQRDLVKAVRTRHQNYYEDSVTLLCLLTILGKA